MMGKYRQTQRSLKGARVEVRGSLLHMDAGCGAVRYGK